MELVIITLDVVDQDDDTYVMESNILPSEIEIFRERMGRGITIGGTLHLVKNQGYEIHAPSGRRGYVMRVKAES